jgi:DNA-binding transcriptional regulator LsrR (DeoR family)
MEHLSTDVEHNNNDKEKERDRIDWRRSKVQELASQGYNQSEISRILQISQPTINRDITYLRQQTNIYSI